MFERYTEAARRAVFFARVEAVHRGETCIEPRDLVVALCRESGTRADAAANLKDLAVDLRTSLEIPHLPITNVPYLQNSKIPLSREGKIAIFLASREADRDGSYWIDTDHLLRGVLGRPTTATDALKQYGVTLDQVRSASQRMRIEHPDPSINTPKKIRFFYHRYRAAAQIVVALVLLLVLILLSKFLGPVN